MMKSESAGDAITATPAGLRLFRLSATILVHLARIARALVSRFWHKHHLRGSDTSKVRKSHARILLAIIATLLTLANVANHKFHSMTQLVNRAMPRRLGYE